MSRNIVSIDHKVHFLIIKRESFNFIAQIMSCIHSEVEVNSLCIRKLRVSLNEIKLRCNELRDSRQVESRLSGIHSI